MKRNKENDWILIGAACYFVVRILPWAILGCLALWWLWNHVEIK